MHLLWWGPLLIAHTLYYTKLSVDGADTKLLSWNTLHLFIWGSLGLWLIIVKFTPKENLVYTELIYMTLMLVSGVLGHSYFTGQLTTFNLYQWSGIALAIIGLFIFKISG